MRNLMTPFTAHPASVGESYVAHMRFAFGFSVTLLAAGLAALVHGILPCFFERTASNLIRDMHARLENR